MALQNDMDRVNRILNNVRYLKYLAQNERAEEEREFCRHDMGHFLDVARLMMILNAEETQAEKPELLYAAALLHDIGRHIQYADGTPHEQASARLAEPILTECGFDNKETDVIINAILHHRDVSVQNEKSLRGLLYRADKLSRPCYACKAEPQCDWKAEKKNLRLLY